MTVDHPSARTLLRLSGKLPVITRSEADRIVGCDECIRHDLAHAGARERLANRVANLQRRGPVGRHRGVRQDPRDHLIAANSGDLFGHVRFDVQVASPGGNDREEGLAVTRHRLQRLRGVSDRNASTRRGRFGRDPDALQDVALLVGRNVRAEEAVDPGRAERHVAGSGSTGFVSTLPGATSPPAQDATSCAVRSAPIRARRTSWPFSKRRLASDRRA